MQTFGVFSTQSYPDMTLGSLNDDQPLVFQEEVAESRKQWASGLCVFRAVAPEPYAPEQMKGVQRCAAVTARSFGHLYLLRVCAIANVGCRQTH